MMELNKIICGKCEGVLKEFPSDFFDSCVTDPPYGISFMNKHWDYNLPPAETWKEILRVLKPGAHILVACGTRTQHRMAVNIEDAGFEIRDVITWHYGSGFPKSLDISKAIDKMNGAEREIIGTKETGADSPNGKGTMQLSKDTFIDEQGRTVYNITAPATEAAKEWEGYGTALKPATEFWTLARKPISENTIAENVLKHGTGGINIDGSRIEIDVDDPNHRDTKPSKSADTSMFNIGGINYGQNSKGRFPANVIFDEFMGQLLDQMSGITESRQGGIGFSDSNIYGTGDKEFTSIRGHDDSGGASRFFYCPKSDNYERNKGLNGFEAQILKGLNASPRENHGEVRNETLHRNHHPTVKPIDLMRYLVKLITPKRGIVLDPFAGSGTTCIGAKLELINYIGIEMNEDYSKIAEARVAAWNPPKYIEQKLF